MTHEPTTLTDSDYARAEQMLAPYRARRVPGSSLQPQWLADGARFWYRIGTRYLMVNLADKSRQDAFDHARLASALSAASGHAAEGTDLPITAVDIRDDATVRFTAFGERWQWSDDAGLSIGGAAPPVPGEAPSPDESFGGFPARRRHLGTASRGAGIRAYR
nr:hypothetical protein [Mycobacterium sp. DL99]